MRKPRPPASSRATIRPVPRLPKGAVRKDARLNLRMPSVMRERLDRAAERDRRSPNDWALLVLEDAIAASEAAAARETKPKGRG